MKNVKAQNARQVVLTMALTLVLLGALAWSVLASNNGPGAPQNGGTVVAAAIRTFYLAPLTSTATIYANTTRETGSNDMSYYHSLDVFAAVDISGTAAVTITPQYSPDNVNWITATYQYQTRSLNTTTTNTSVLTQTTSTTPTTTLTATMTTTATTSVASTESITTATYQIVLDADGEVDYFTMPMTGYYLRFAIEYTTTGTVTPTVKVIARND